MIPAAPTIVATGNPVGSFPSDFTRWLVRRARSSARVALPTWVMGRGAHLRPVATADPRLFAWVIGRAARPLVGRFQNQWSCA